MNPSDNRQEGKNLNHTEFESRVYEVSDEESTIFSNPAEHRDIVKKGVKLKKFIIAAIALVLVAAITVTVAITIPPLLDDKDDTSSTEIDPPMMDSALFKNVDRATLIRDDAKVEFCIVDVEKKTEDDEGNTVTETVKEWALKNVDRSLTSYTNIDNTVSNFMEQHYTKKISSDKGDGTDYGFDDPEYQVDFYKEGSDDIYLSLIIGGMNPTQSGRYATTSLDNSVYYIAGVSEFYHYQKNETDFVNPEEIPAIAKAEDYSDANFTEGTLVMCDKMILSGKTFGDEYTIISKKSDNVKVFNSYHITSPVTRAANDENIGNIVALFTYGVTADGCYSYSVAEEELIKYGLNDPDFEVKIYVGDIVDGFKATPQEDGNYAVYYEGNKTIMKVSASGIAPAAYGRAELFNELLFIENISNADKITVQSGGETLEFSIATKFDEEAQRDTISTVKCDGKTIETSNFQNYYSYLIQIRAQSYEEHDTSGLEPDTVFTVYHKDKSSPTVVKYFKITNARYQVETNGVKMGLISSSDHTRVMKYAKNVAQDKTYNSR